MSSERKETEVEFSGQMALTSDELRAADWDVEQATQARLGLAGVEVLEATALEDLEEDQ